MKKSERIKIVKAATQELIAKGGVVNFSIKEVSQMTGIVEPMIFRDFTTTKNLFNECYLDYVRELDQFFETIQIPPFSDRSQYKGHLQFFWFSYMSYLIRKGHATVFYYEFKFNETGKLKIQKDQALQPVHLMKQLLEVLDIRDDMMAQVIWSYIEMNALSFASQIINGQLDNTPAVLDTIRKLVFHGLEAILEEPSGD